MCEKCGEKFQKDPRMWPVYLKYKAGCPACGHATAVEYHPGKGKPRNQRDKAKMDAAAKAKADAEAGGKPSG